LFLQTQGQVKANFSDLQLATVPNHKEKSAKFVFYGSFGILPQEGDVTLSETHRDSRRLPSWSPDEHFLVFVPEHWHEINWVQPHESA